MGSDLRALPRVMRTLQSTGRALTGGRPALSACVVVAAAGTAALQSSGVNGWWLVPPVTLALVAGFSRWGR